MSLPAEAYSRLCQISKMKYFVKIFNNLTLSCIMFGHLTTLCIKGLKAVNPLRTERILPNSQGRTYTSLMRSTRTHSVWTSATKDVYIRPLTVSHTTKIFSC